MELQVLELSKDLHPEIPVFSISTISSDPASKMVQTAGTGSMQGQLNLSLALF